MTDSQYSLPQLTSKSNVIELSLFVGTITIFLAHIFYRTSFITQHVIEKINLLIVSSVTMFFVTMILAQLLKKLLPKFHKEDVWILNFLKLVVCVSTTTLCGYTVRLIPYYIYHMYPFKHSDFTQIEIRELRGTILVAPAFMLFLRDLFSDYLQLVKL